MYLLLVPSFSVIMQFKRRKMVIDKVATNPRRVGQFAVKQERLPVKWRSLPVGHGARCPREQHVHRRRVCWVVTASPSYWSIHSILAGAQVGHRVLHCRIGEIGVLLGFEPQTGQAGVAGVSVHVGAGGGSIGARGRSHRYRVEGRGTVEVVEVAQVVEPRGWNPGHC